MKIWLKNYQWHIIAWTVFILYEVLSISLILGVNGKLLGYIVYYMINISLFYIHSDLVLTKPLAHKKPRYLNLALLIILEICTYVVLSYLADRITSIPEKLPPLGEGEINWKFIFGTLWRGIYFILFATAHYFLKRYMQQKQRTAELEKDAIKKELREKQNTIELANAKNAYLKAQINPHFLFNTLTYIYNSTHKSEPRAAEAVRYLSKLMRYALECEHGPEVMSIDAEIQQVENLLQLSRIKQPNLFIDFTYDEGIVKSKIIPLVILSLTENMVKHGDLSLPGSPGIIRVKAADGLFTIETENLINTGLNDNGFHTGLTNIRQRLFHTYGEKAALEHSRDGHNRFTTRVSIMVKDW